MKRLFFLLPFLLACGVSSTLPTPTPQVLTQIAPTNTSAPEVLTSTPAPETRRVCADNVNARNHDATKVIGWLVRGTVVTLTGEKFRVGAEVWQPTDAGLVDPQYLCK